MTYRIWHATDEKSRFGFNATTFPEDFRHVADVTADDLDGAYELTNHIHRNWAANPEVTMPWHVSPLRVRSTSVGDIIEVGPYYYAVAPVGFLRLPSLDGRFQTRVPELYRLDGLALTSARGGDDA